jgi:hypothetical protein
MRPRIERGEQRSYRQACAARQARYECEPVVGAGNSSSSHSQIHTGIDEDLAAAGKRRHHPVGIEIQIFLLQVILAFVEIKPDVLGSGALRP